MIRQTTATVLRNVTGKVIEGIFFDTDGFGLQLFDCKDIVIRNCWFRTYEAAMDFYNSTGINVQDCLVVNSRSGLYAQGCANVKVNNLQVVNPTSRTKDPYFKDRGYQRLGQAVQLDKCSGGNYIGHVKGEAFEDDYYFVEDWINIYDNENRGGKCIIENCRLRGGKSPSGGGILVGDQGSSNNTVRHNITWNVGNYSFAVAGGENNLVHDNIAYQEQRSWAKEAFYVWNQTTKVCRSITLRNNRANVTNLEGSLKFLWYLPSYQEGNFAPNCTGDIQVPTFIEKKDIDFPSQLITLCTTAQLYALRKGLPLPVESTLPVTWGAITVNMDSITWVTETEENNNYFVVEESRDGGKKFSPLMTVAAKGASTYTVPLPHDTRRVEPKQSVWCNWFGWGCKSATVQRVNTRKVYRIRQVDHDGKKTYSTTKTIIR